MWIMNYRTYKETKLSRLGMGAMRLPMLEAGKDTAIDYESSQEIIDYGMANGINYYDTAYVYHGGQSEIFLGKALKKYDRESFYVTDKFLIGANPDYRSVFEEQLKKLQVDHIDFYLIHSIGDNTIDQYINSGCIEFFENQKELGRIKNLGFSSHASTPVLERFADFRAWDFAQIQLNYYDWNYGNARSEYEALRNRGIPIMVMEPVRGGRLASLTPGAEELLKKAHPDWSIPSWALRFVSSLPGVCVVLSGMSNLEQIEDNVATFSDDYVFTEADRDVLFEACTRFKEQIKIPCTACRYCTDGCPVKINIPEFLKLYNSLKVNGSWGIKERAEKIVSEGKPSDCIGCGKCTGHCPQNIAVPAAMEELAGVI